MIHLLPHRFETTSLREELDSHPEVWNQYRWRTDHPRSPHRECSDIWARYSGEMKIAPKNQPHESVWYPVVEAIPSVRDLTEQMMRLVEGKELGGVLVTKIPAGKQVYPHVDGGWHAEHYEKFAILVQGNPEQEFCFEGCSLRCREGDSFTFNNQHAHWVTNATPEDRITLIICIRRAH
jgi:quercetin dioxygenase-like cupin family protein